MNSNRKQGVPKDALQDWQGMEVLLVEYDNCSFKSKGVDPASWMYLLYSNATPPLASGSCSPGGLSESLLY